MTRGPSRRPRRLASRATVQRLDRVVGDLATEATRRMDETLPWYRALAAEERSLVALIAHAGISAFLDWLRDPAVADRPALTTDVFAAAPRELARRISLGQTVELIRATVTVVEERVPELAAPADADGLRWAVLAYSREVAFAAAQVYAQAAEARGAWDARLEAIVVDALLRDDVDDAVLSRAAALGWGGRGGLVVVAGRSPDAAPDLVADEVRRAARLARLDAVSGVQGDRLVVALSGAAEPLAAATTVADAFAPGPVVVGALAADLPEAAARTRGVLAALAAADGWPGAPRPVAAEALLPERALAGDPEAREAIVALAVTPLVAAGGDLLTTLTAYLEDTASIEGTARALYVHPNTVRYRLRRVAEVTGLVPTEPRDAFTLRVALTLSRLPTAPTP